MLPLWLLFVVTAAVAAIAVVAAIVAAAVAAVAAVAVVAAVVGSSCSGCWWCRARRQNYEAPALLLDAKVRAIVLASLLAPCSDRAASRLLASWSYSSNMFPGNTTNRARLYNA